MLSTLGQKVLILVNHEITIYKFRREFVLKLLDQGHQVYISSPKGERIEEFVELGCTHIDTEIDRRGVNPLKDFKLLVNYHKMIKEINPDIIYSYTVKPNVYGGIIARKLKTPFVATVTGLGSAVAGNKNLAKIIINLYKISLRKAQKLFVQNIGNYQFFIENKILTEKKIDLVPGSGVNLSQFNMKKYPEKENEINFVYIGRLMKEKGILELFEAAEYFEKKSIKVNFHILGFLEDDLEQILSELDKKGIVIYHGQQSDVDPFIRKSHAIIHPSYHEGLSNVLLEAAASGRPILASDIPGCRETFDEGITGFGFEPKSTESLIKTIEKFIDLPHEQKEQMGILGRKKIEKEFNREKVVDTYILEIDNLK